MNLTEMLRRIKMNGTSGEQSEDGGLGSILDKIGATSNSVPSFEDRSEYGSSMLQDIIPLIMNKMRGQNIDSINSLRDNSDKSVDIRKKLLGDIDMANGIIDNYMRNRGRR